MGLREQISSQYKVSRWIGDEAIVSCPHPDHTDRNPSAAINVKKRLWTCYSCGRGGTLDSLLGSTISDPDVEELLVEISSQLAGFDSVQHGYPESWLDQFDFNSPHPYWLGRGLSTWVVKEFRLGYDFETDAATYPLRGPSGTVLGVVRRTIGDKPGPKYRYPDHAPVSKTLFGYYKVRAGVGGIAVTEGALDALALWDIDVPAVAQMGATLSDDQVALLRKLNPTSITFAYDQDPAGSRALARAVGHKDLRFCPLRVMEWDRAQGKDPLELSHFDRQSAYATARLV
jgi:DNA primase